MPAKLWVRTTQLQENTQRSCKIWKRGSEWTPSRVLNKTRRLSQGRGKTVAKGFIEVPPTLGRILMRWLGLAALSGSFMATPVIYAQGPVITNPKDLNVLAVNEAFDPA